MLSPFRGTKKASVYSSLKTPAQQNLRQVYKFVRRQAESDPLFAPQPLVFHDPHMFGTPGAGVRQAKRA